MHERNIYKIPPNFAELAKKYEFLIPFLSVNDKGAPKLNFKDQDALRALTRALLLEDFQLDVEIPEEVLVPTVPLRLNYILWVEDLLSYNDNFGKSGSEICGIDVGTGATAVYALLAAKKNQWRMVGTEIEPESVMVAKSNVQRNCLGQLVEIRYVKESVLERILADTIPGQFAFTMCNPPFFGHDEETDSIAKSRKPDRPHPSGARSGTKNELIVPGGELEFIFQMIADSKVHQNSVKIFTTMVGIKKHLKDLILKLKTEGITNFITTEFSQGKTMRWGLAWTFDPQVHLQPPAQVSHTFESIPGCLNFENYVYSHLENLKFSCLEWIPNNNVPDEASSTSAMLVDEPGAMLHFIATENTWTGQRRRRRLLEKAEDGPSPRKMVRTIPEDQNGGMDVTTEAIFNSLTQILLEGNVQIIREGSRATIAMRLLGGSLGKDGMNQIMTYLKNCYNRDLQNPASELYQLTRCEKGVL